MRAAEAGGEKATLREVDGATRVAEFASVLLLAEGSAARRRGSRSRGGFVGDGVAFPSRAPEGLAPSEQPTGGTIEMTFFCVSVAGGGGSDEKVSPRTDSMAVGAGYVHPVSGPRADCVRLDVLKGIGVGGCTNTG